MSTDKLRFTGTCIISISIISLAAALFYIGYEVAQIRKMTPEVMSKTDKILTKFHPIFEKRDGNQNMISDIISEVSAVNRKIPDVLVTVDKITTEIERIRPLLPDIMARVDDINSQIPAILERVDQTNQNIPPIISQVEGVRKDMPVILDRADKLIADADALSKKAGEQAGRGVYKGVIKGVIGLPMDTIDSVLKETDRKIKKTENTKEESDTKNED